MVFNRFPYFDGLCWYFVVSLLIPMAFIVKSSFSNCWIQHSWINHLSTGAGFRNHSLYVPWYPTHSPRGSHWRVLAAAVPTNLLQCKLLVSVVLMHVLPKKLLLQKKMHKRRFRRSSPSSGVRDVDGGVPSGMNGNPVGGGSALQDTGEASFVCSSIGKAIHIWLTTRQVNDFNMQFHRFPEIHRCMPRLPCWVKVALCLRF